MTTVDEMTGIADVITEAINSAGLKLELSEGIPSLDGGLTFGVFTDPDGESATEITLATITEAGIELYDVANDAISGADTGLSAGTPQSIGAATGLDTVRHGEVTHHVITHGGHPVGMVIVDADRRKTEAPEEESPEEEVVADYPPQNYSVPPSAPLSGEGNLTMLSDVMLNVTVELGRQSLTLSQVLNLSVGSVVELDRAAGAPVDIRVNGILFGRGEVVVVDDEYAVRVIEILETPGR